LTKRVGKKSAGGFVNAVLRTVSRKRSTLPLPPRPVDTRDRQAALDYFSITLSHPRWLAVRWLDRLGFDRAERWLQFNNTPAPLTLRANRLAGDRDDLPTHLRQHGVALKRTRYAPDGFIVEEGHPLRDPGAASGWFVVQDEASQLVALLAGPAPGRLILDACASPGGKTTAFAAAATPEARIVACDVRERRIDLLRRTLHNTRTVNVAVVQADLLSPLPFRIPFDCVVVDAPCSGLGTLRRDPDIRWRRRESDLSILAAAELKMLRNAADVVAPGGRLIYATCSSEPEENEMIAGAFVEGAPEFSTIDVRNVHPALDASLVDDRGHLRTTPDLHGLEAFFGAVFERRRR
jgi:16S rRNA (cytosine967-C5)-methyltransferase